MVEIYSPEEDSYLMSEFLKKEIKRRVKHEPHLKLLEIGSGSGINLITAFESGIDKKNIFSCDINHKSVKHCKFIGFNCIISNLFNKIPIQKFDIIIFNPPYLPEDNLEPRDSKTSTTGGKKGNELSIKFLKQAKKYLSKKGEILLITSSLSESIDFNKLNYKFKLLGNKNLFFETLFLWRISF
jgi:release factor glutamine methyltransferase